MDIYKNQTVSYWHGYDKTKFVFLLNSACFLANLQNT